MPIITGKQVADSGVRINLNGRSENEPIVSAEFEGVTVYFSVEDLSEEFFGYIRESDEKVQEYVDVLAANLGVPSDYDGEVLSIDRRNFNDSFGDMMQDLRERYVQGIRRRLNALQAIARECFGELCAGLPDEIIDKRLEDAIQSTIKEQTK